MKNLKYIFLFTALLGVLNSSIKAQDTPPATPDEPDSTATIEDLYRVQIMARSYGDSIVLRWAYPPRQPHLAKLQIAPYFCRKKDESKTESESAATDGGALFQKRKVGKNYCT